MSAAANPADAAPRSMRELWIGFACVGVIIALWSGFQLASRFSARASLNAADLSALRFAISGAIMLPWLVRNGLHGVSWARSIVLAATGGLGFAFFAFAGFMYAPASHAAALMSGALPLFTAIAASLLIGERLGPMKQLGLALIIGGVVFIGIESFAAAGLGYWRGDLCFIGAASFWSLFTVACRAWRITPMQATVIVSTFCMFAYLPVYFLFATPQFAQVPAGELVFQVIYQGFIATILTMFAYTRAVAILGAATTTMMTAAVPGIVTLSAAPLLGEIPSWLTLAGITLVTMGMIATVLTLRPAHAKP